MPLLRQELTIVIHWSTVSRNVFYSVCRVSLIVLQGSFSNRYDHVTPLLIQLHWLSIEHRITFKIAVITFMALHGTATDYITGLIQPNTPSGTLWSSKKKLLLFKAKFNLKTYGGWSFTIAAPLFGILFHWTLDLEILFLLLNWG